MIPLFVDENLEEGATSPIGSMPGVSRWSIAALREEKIPELLKNGLNKIILFGIPREKDPVGSAGWDDQGIIQKTSRALKKEFGSGLLVAADLCFCEYTDHGHCGVLDSQGHVRNDPTLENIRKTGISYAAAGVDLLAPSGMMDGTIGALRGESELKDVPIMSYAVKYASAFYGPFRDAADSTPASGDRRGYQMDPGNSREADLEAGLDEEEGADILMVKPAGAYLDIIRRVREITVRPLAAYQVSGEYAMYIHGARQGGFDLKAVVRESLLSMKRAGAGMILSYFDQIIPEVVD